MRICHRISKFIIHSCEGILIQFFIVGTGRCGTELLRGILNRHSQVYVPGESHWIPSQYDFYGHLRNPPEAYSDIVNRTFYHNGDRTVQRIAGDIGLTPEAFLQRVEDGLRTVPPTIAEFNNELFRLAGESAGRTFVGDKTPDYGTYMSLLHSLWPSAKFIHLVRDGRDAAISMSKHGGFQRLLSCRAHNWVPVSLDKRYQLMYGADDQHSIDDYLGLWASRVRRTLDEASRLPRECYAEVRYEDLLMEPTSTLRKIMEFLGIESSDEWRTAVTESVRSDNVGKFHNMTGVVSPTSLVTSTLQSLGYETRFD